ncbi:MAG TPA: C4-type zinc ribbon domain-containing protein [Kiritimatiellia bacterium]|nr:C4-type zinc ribbon domain-containing protein [Kiritimatiellia bacterium]
MIDQLLELQDYDRRIRQFTRESKDIPARKAMVESRLQQHRDSLEQSREALKKTLSATKQVELDIEARQDKIRKYLEQQNKVKNNEEYRALETEIKGLRKQVKELEEKEISFMEQAEADKARSADLEGSLAGEEQTVAGDTGMLDERLVRIQEELAKVTEMRNAKAKEIDPIWLSRYDRIFKNRGDFAIVPVDNGTTCGGCRLKLPPQVVQDVKRGDTMASCPHCGRLLYWPG